MTDNFLKLTQTRRSIYDLGTETSLYPEETNRLFRECLKQCPTPFNSQSGRMVVLYNRYSKRLWNLTADILEQMTTPEQFKKTRQKLDSFAAGIGTVLFFIDDEVTASLQEQFPLYAERFPVWAEQANGMLQYMIWTALAEHELGASLQHYNPLIDEQVRHTFEIPLTWRLTAQMPFGSIMAPAGEKTFEPLDKRIKIFS